MANETTLQANIRTNADTELAKIPRGFRLAVQAAREFEAAVGKAGTAAERLGAKAGAAFGNARSSLANAASRFSARGGIGQNQAFSAAQFISGQIQGALPQEGYGAVAGSILSNTAQYGAAGGQVGGPAGAAIGVAVGAIVSSFDVYRRTVDELSAETRRASDAFSKMYAANDVIIKSLRDLAAISTEGFTATERAAYDRLIAEQKAALNTKKEADTNDTQTIGDRFIVEQAKTREAVERLGVYLERTGYSAEILKRASVDSNAGRPTPGGNPF